MSRVPSDYKPLTNNEEYLYKKYDQFQDVSFVRHYEFFGLFGSLPIEIYDVNKRILRIVFTYWGNDWIFFDKAIIINSNGGRKIFSIEYFNKKTNIDGSFVTETIDMYLPSKDTDDILAIISRPGLIKIRLTGEYSRDYELSPEKVKALIDVIKYNRKQETDQPVTIIR
jgi:hypothetical protein